jgi:hypothetical protein
VIRKWIINSKFSQSVSEAPDGHQHRQGAEAAERAALHKAQTSARFPFPTRGVQELAYGKDLKGAGYQDLRWFPELLLSLAGCQS